MAFTGKLFRTSLSVWVVEIRVLRTVVFFDGKTSKIIIYIYIYIYLIYIYTDIDIDIDIDR